MHNHHQMCGEATHDVKEAKLQPFFCRGKKLFEAKDRSGIEFPDPFPGLLHEYIDVGNAR
jgi:hypothetical protein